MKMDIINEAKEFRVEKDALPCPFCGGKEIVTYSYNHSVGKRFAIMCTNCIAEIDPGWAQSRYPVLRLWNTREGKE